MSVVEKIAWRIAPDPGFLGQSIDVCTKWQALASSMNGSHYVFGFRPGSP